MALPAAEAAALSLRHLSCPCASLRASTAASAAAVSGRGSRLHVDPQKHQRIAAPRVVAAAIRPRAMTLTWHQSQASSADEAPAGSAGSSGVRIGSFLRDDVGPNAVVLEAMGKVCTGPTQTRPLEEQKMREVLQLILLSAKGELTPSDRVSLAQMGAFFGAMTLRATSFPAATQWSEGEAAAMHQAWPALRQFLPPEVLFLADPEGSIFDDPSPVGPEYSGNGGQAERRLVGALREVLEGGHLGFEETKALLQDVLPMKGGGSDVSDALVAAFFICQRMNRETDRELKAYCLAFDQELGPAPVADVASLTHYGEPYDGSNRFFRPSLFVAAVRAAERNCCLLHGTDIMPPKLGVTEEQQLLLMGANCSLTPQQAATLIEDDSIGLAYLSLKDCCPSLFSLRDLRYHIKKRPTFATSEKVQQYVRASGKEAIMAGFYHDGYEEPLLMLMRRRQVQAGMVIKGEEGSLSLTTRPRSDDQREGRKREEGRIVNFCAGFREMSCEGTGGFDGCGRGGGGAMLQNEADESDRRGVVGREDSHQEAAHQEAFHREAFASVIEAADFGILPSNSPRVDRSAAKNLALGLAALRGERGAAYDRIVLNAAVADYHLRLTAADAALDRLAAVERAREAIDSGRALRVLEAYVAATNKM